MLIDFSSTKEITIPCMNGGNGLMSAKMYIDADGKIIISRIHKGGKIGCHKHETSDDINFVLSGTGVAVCDGVPEKLCKDVCHVCKKGSQHSIENTGDDDLILLTVVNEK